MMDSLGHASTRASGLGTTVAWLLASALAIYFALQSLTPDGHFFSYFLTGIDSFYHATRAFMVASGLPFFEFDTRSYYPDGTWINWPWAYDYLLSGIASLTLALGKDPIVPLVFLPVWAAALNLLLLTLLCRQLGLGTAMTAMVLLITAITPSFQHLHLAGRIDHHFIQMGFTLAVLLALVLWARDNSDIRKATGLGVILGFAHIGGNGDFLLQLGPLFYAGILWLRGEALDTRGVTCLGAGLIGATLLLLLGSAHFHELTFDYAVLSWFHLYIAALTALALQLLARFRMTPRSLAGIMTGLAFSLLPAAWLIVQGLGFVGATEFNAMETEPVTSMAPGASLMLYSPFLLVSVPALLWLLIRSLEKPGPRLAYSAASIIGLALFLFQVRFNYYGLAALVLPTALLLQDFLDRRIAGAVTWQAWIAVVLALLITFPVTRPALVENPIRQFNPEYFENLVVFDAVSQLCRIDPGPILAHPNQGQYLLFHTGCPVYSTNHAAWEAQYRGRQRTLDMLALTPAELRQQYPDVKYVLLNRYDGTRPVERPEAKTLNQRGLHGALLQGPVDPASGFAMVSEVKAQRDNDIYPLTRLFLVSDISEEESQ